MTDGKSRTAALSEISLISATVFWGLNFAATKYAAEFVPPLVFMALRFAGGGLLLLLVLRLLEPASRLGRRDLVPMAALGCFGVATAQTGFTFGVSLSSAASTGLIFATAPVWGLFFGFVLGLERPTWTGISGVGLSILGVGVIFYEGLGLEWANLIGDFLVLLAAMGFGAYTVLSMRLLGRYSPLAVATFPILFGGPLVLLISVPFFAAPGWGA
jgi:drug/metabolite transporter (DMT)-like permease